MLLRSTAGIEQSQGCEESIDIVVSPRHCTGQPTDASRSFQLSWTFFAGERVENSSLVRPFISQSPSTLKAMYTNGHSRDKVVLTERSEVYDSSCPCVRSR